MTTTTPAAAAPSKLSPDELRRLKKWSKKFNARVATMVEEFSKEDLQLTRESFGENFERRKPALDLFMFGAFASLASGVSLDELLRLAQHVQEERQKTDGAHPDKLIDDDEEG